MQAAAEPELETPPTTPSIAVSVSASFPAAEVFGVKLVNGHATQALLEFTNNEPEAIRVALIGGALATLQPLAPGTPEYAGILRNLTVTKYDVAVQAGGKETLSYTFATDMNPEDVRLQLVAVVQNQEGELHQIPAFGGEVSIVEAPTSFLDPQMYVHSVHPKFWLF